MHRYYRETGSNEGYIVIVDFKGYFDHILHNELGKILDRYILDTRLNALTKHFISASDPYKPPEERGMGLYIDLEDSQIHTIAYPNVIDHIIKDRWRQKYYGRYMDDSYIIFRTKEEAHHYLNLLLREYEKMGIIPNPKKTQIIKLSRGFTFLKTKYFLTSNGRIIQKADHNAVVRERRKLKKFKRFYDTGEMTVDQIIQSYMSWRGSLAKRNAYRSILTMDRLFYELFRCCPWKTKKK